MKHVYPIAVSCHVLQVSCSGYFRWRCNGSQVSQRCSDELALAHIRAIHTELKGEYGWPRMHKELQAHGLRIGKERVRKLMACHGIRAKTKRKFVVTTDSKHHLPIAPAGTTLRENIIKWAEETKCESMASTHWMVIWPLSVTDYRLDAPLMFRGSFESAMEQVFELYRTAQKPLYAQASRMQCIITVSDTRDGR